MKLTKKSKEAFENWLVNDSVLCTVPFANHWFYEQPSSMQFGVYVDFFESVGLDVEAIRRAYKRGKDYEWSVLNIERDEVVRSGFSDSRLSARESAVSSANDYFNEIVG